MSPVISELISVLGADRVLTQTHNLIPYSFDGTSALRQQPSCVIFPKTVEEVSGVFRVATAQHVPVVTPGSGTG